MEIKNSKKVFYILVILSLLVISLCGYIIYNKIAKKDNWIDSFDHLKIDITNCMSNSFQQYCNEVVDFNKAIINIKVEKRVANITTRINENYKYIGHKALYINDKIYNLSDENYIMTGIIYLINDIVLVEINEVNSNAISLIAFDQKSTFVETINN